MNVTLMLKSVAKLFHIILYTYSVKTNLNLCESFYFDYHLRELKGFHSLLLFWNTTWEIYTEHNPLQGPHTDTLCCNCVRRYKLKNIKLIFWAQKSTPPSSATGPPNEKPTSLVAAPDAVIPENSLLLLGVDWFDLTDLASIFACSSCSSYSSIMFETLQYFVL